MLSSYFDSFIAFSTFNMQANQFQMQYSLVTLIIIMQSNFETISTSSIHPLAIQPVHSSWSSA